MIRELHSILNHLTDMWSYILLVNVSLELVKRDDEAITTPHAVSDVPRALRQYRTHVKSLFTNLNYMYIQLHVFFATKLDIQRQTQRQHANKI